LLLHQRRVLLLRPSWARHRGKAGAGWAAREKAGEGWAEVDGVVLGWEAVEAAVRVALAEGDLAVWVCGAATGEGAEAALAKERMAVARVAGTGLQ
jgi:hypothetical protein